MTEGLDARTHADFPLRAPAHENEPGEGKTTALASACGSSRPDGLSMSDQDRFACRWFSRDVAAKNGLVDVVAAIARALGDDAAGGVTA